jgi:hypothetical protein
MNEESSKGWELVLNDNICKIERKTVKKLF